ncbi:MAG: lactate racemase [Thermodesulfobacteriota bacterium]|nr:lactate racemase [Thermodesulfobacteriota bacterium]
MAKAVTLPWGDGTLELMLPDSCRILGELVPQPMEPARPGACSVALSNPWDTQRLASRDLRDKKIVVVVDDHSRPTPVATFLDQILDEIAAGGAADKNIRILVAIGVHRPSRSEEIESKLGTEIMNRFSWSCHDAYDPDGLVELGSTSRGTKVVLNKLLLEADLIICVGSIEPHLLLGFGGGLKMIIPGCAGAETIGKNHLQGVDPDSFDYVGVRGDISPMRLDLEEGAALLSKDIFVINVAMNEHARPTRFFCGDPIKAHRAGEAFVESAARLEVHEQADIVLTNSFPMEFDLRQSVKCLGNTLYACKPGGVMMACAKAQVGLGEMPLPKKTLPYGVMRGILKIVGKGGVLPLVKKAKKGEPVEEVFIGHFGLQMLRRNHLGIYCDSPLLPNDIGRKMGLAKSFTSREDFMSWGASRAPKRATVWVFPFGGSTYARCV